VTVVNRVSPYKDVVMAGTPDYRTIRAAAVKVPTPSVKDAKSTWTNVLFRKVADRSEAVAGGTIRYTLYVKNVLDHTIDDASISDRFDPMLMSSPDAPSGMRTFAVPVLQPGAEWKVSYTLHVSEALANGTVLSNIATLQGSDVESSPLSERVRVTQTGIMTGMPQTGAPLDLLFVLTTSGMAFGSMVASRRKLM